MNTNCVVRREFIEDYSEETIKENTPSDIDAILQSLLSTESRSLRLISVTVRISLLFIVLFFLNSFYWLACWLYVWFCLSQTCFYRLLRYYISSYLYITLKVLSSVNVYAVVIQVIDDWTSHENVTWHFYIHKNNPAKYDWPIPLSV